MLANSRDTIIDFNFVVGEKGISVDELRCNYQEIINLLHNICGPDVELLAESSTYSKKFHHIINQWLRKQIKHTELLMGASSIPSPPMTWTQTQAIKNAVKTLKSSTLSGSSSPSPGKKIRNGNNIVSSFLYAKGKLIGDLNEEMLTTPFPVTIGNTLLSTISEATSEPEVNIKQ